MKPGTVSSVLVRSKEVSDVHGLPAEYPVTALQRACDVSHEEVANPSPREGSNHASTLHSTLLFILQLEVATAMRTGLRGRL